jgi:hypothetical protein
MLACVDKRVGSRIGVAFDAPGGLPQQRGVLLEKRRPCLVIAGCDACDEGLQVVAGERRHARMLQDG